MLDTLVPPDLPEQALSSFALGAYGLAGKWSRLEGERDQNFRVTAASGESFVFKVCHPAEGEDVLTCQALALEHIALADPALPVPRLIRSVTGEPLPRLTHDGVTYPVMVLSWLTGDVLGDAVLPPDHVRELGKLLARLGLAMRGFVHGAPAERNLVWDTRQVLSAWPRGGKPAGGRSCARRGDSHAPSRCDRAADAADAEPDHSWRRSSL